MSSKNKIIDSTLFDKIQVRSYNCNDVITLSSLYSREAIPLNVEHIPTPEKAAIWPNLSILESKLMPFNPHIDVGLLIGYDHGSALELLDTIRSKYGSPIGQKSILGWGIVGNVKQRSKDCNFDHQSFSFKVECNVHVKHETSFVFKTRVKQVFNPETVLSVLQGDFLTSEYESGDAHSQEDKLFLDILNKGICYKESRYEMPLPFKQDRPPLLPNNQGVAYHRPVSFCCIFVYLLVDGVESHSFNIFIKSYAMKFVVFCRLNPISARCIILLNKLFESESESVVWSNREFLYF